MTINPKYLKTWQQKGSEVVESNKIDEIIRNELTNHAFRISIEIISKELKLKSDMKIFEAGFGWGRLIVGLKQNFQHLKIDGIDISPAYVQKAIELMVQLKLKSNVNLFHGDLNRIQLQGNEYDGFYSVRVFQYIENQEFVLKQLYRGLKKGGRGIIIIPNRKCPYRWFTYKHAPLQNIKKLKTIMLNLGYLNLRVGGFGFIPPFLSFSKSSPLCELNTFISSIPILKNYGGLAYVVGEK